jgi:hypothetical protein
MDQRHHVTESSAPGQSEARPERAESSRKLIDENRASALLGVSPETLRRISSETGLGHAESEGQGRVVFTYAELYRLCRSAASATN